MTTPITKDKLQEMLGQNSTYGYDDTEINDMANGQPTKDEIRGIDDLFHNNTKTYVYTLLIDYVEGTGRIGFARDDYGAVIC